ncbi:lysine--tRNA ligase [bacterium]|nr:lysine--tRNA ligase [bacterium]NBX81761.1 lysine--tRNA ligase [bacterium]
MEKSMSTSELPTVHWADHAADALVAKHPQKTTFVCASGISPSGVVHIGNFREVITVDFVVRALKSKGKDVRFIYSWDDYDALRKVPANLPNQELIEKNLRRPLSNIPDPFGTEASYAQHFERKFEKEIQQLGITPHFIYQNEQYRACKYHQGIQTALRNEKAIAQILNRSRTEPLPQNWSCLSIFCKTCGKDTTEVLSFQEPSTVQYACKSCKRQDQIDFTREAGVKLLWRVDWPMRWAHEGVDFEPGGKDHSSQGGSYDTGCEIVREIWKREPPFYVQYDFVLAKGVGSKLSSSSGNLITLGQALEIYEPAIIRYLFASRKPNLDFSIAFDLDVMKAYDDFDRCERIAFGAEKVDEKKLNYEKRIYDFSRIETAALTQDMPTQFPFRHLCNLLQIQEGDLEKTKLFYQAQIKTPQDEQRYYSRAHRAWKWISEYAPTEFRFTLQTNPQVKTAFPQVMTGLIALLKEMPPQVSEEELANRTWEIMKAHQIEGKVFFKDIYQILVSKPNGPKLASFLLAIGTKRAAEILQKALPES